MAQDIKINQAAVKENAQAISGAASYFSGESLNQMDAKSTITANGKGQAAYADAQAVIVLLGETLDKEAENIRSLGLKFQEYDEMMTNLQQKRSN